VVCDDGARYILQQINTDVFRDPSALMRNIELVTAHLRSKVSRPSRRTPPRFRKETAAHYAVENGGYWRVYELRQQQRCYQSADETLFYESAVALRTVSESTLVFPRGLAETNTHFHDTPARYAAFLRAVEENASGRRGDVHG
jgi:N-acetylhexosamine 1-kinase